jgi:hypothetical protein
MAKHPRTIHRGEILPALEFQGQGEEGLFEAGGGGYGIK